MTEKQILNTLDEIEVYFIQCHSSAAVGGRAEKRFERYISCVDTVKKMIRQQKAAENKEANT